MSGLGSLSKFYVGAPGATDIQPLSMLLGFFVEEEHSVLIFDFLDLPKARCKEGWKWKAIDVYAGSHEVTTSTLLART